MGYHIPWHVGCLDIWYSAAQRPPTSSIVNNDTNHHIINQSYRFSENMRSLALEEGQMAWWFWLIKVFFLQTIFLITPEIFSSNAMWVVNVDHNLIDTLCNPRPPDLAGIFQFNFDLWCPAVCSESRNGTEKDIYHFGLQSFSSCRIRMYFIELTSDDTPTTT